MTRSDTNRAVQSQNKARTLKLWIEVDKELYYPSGGNKGADQLCSYCTADLRLCFRICKLLFFSCEGSYYLSISSKAFIKILQLKVKAMLSLCKSQM